MSAGAASAAIARFAAGFDAARLQPHHYRVVSRALLDTVAVGIAGLGDPATRLATDYARALGGAGSRFWGEPQAGRCDAEAAALRNGVAAHVLDYDDVAIPMRGHPSVALLPALLALGEAEDVSGRDLAVAYAVGFEVICRVSRAMAADHYAKGWHSTASIGTLGAAVACARLLRLDATGVQNAIGLAVAQAAGARSNFGTMAKSFQAGQTGAAAIRAARLARLGFTSAPEALDGVFGYMALYGAGEDLEPQLEGLGGDGELELVRSGLEVKRYPMCYATHRTLDGLLALRREEDLTLDMVRTVDVQASNRAFVPLIHTRPQTGLEGKFSMQYAVALALADGAVELRSFTDAAVQRPAVQAFLPHVTTREAEGSLLPRWAEMSVTLKDGRQLRRRVDGLRGSAEDPLTDDELHAKVRDCFAWAGRGGHVQAFIDAAQRLEHVSLRQLLDAVDARSATSLENDR
jgi:2-methylcitrate dehydratase PrpD